MALKTGNIKKLNKGEAIDLSSLANLMKVVGDITKEANDLELANIGKNRQKEK